MSLIKRFFHYLWRRFTSFFLKGLVLILPIGVTGYVVYKTFMFLDGIIPYETPGVSIALIIVGLVILGFVGTLFIQTPVIRLFDRLLARIPLVKFIYTSIRDLLSAFVGKEKRFSKPVLVRTGAEGIYKMGFITQQDLTHLGIKEGKSAVYMPHSYNFSGNLFIVDNNLITTIEAPTDEIMKFIVSGGITRI